eukprot:gene31669-36270_t
MTLKTNLYLSAMAGALIVGAAATAQTAPAPATAGAPAAGQTAPATAAPAA